MFSEVHTFKCKHNCITPDKANSSYKVNLSLNDLLLLQAKQYFTSTLSASSGTQEAVEHLCSYSKWKEVIPSEFIVFFAENNFFCFSKTPK